MLEEKRWQLVEALCEYSTKLNIKSDSTNRIITINHAIALKEQNKTDEMLELLEQKDWSSCAIKFHVALHVKPRRSPMKKG